jgi:D-threonate/D-erythronate kinase
MQTDTRDSQMQAGTERIRAGGVVIVADDLTGACDSGVAFVRSGRAVRVVLDAMRFDFASLQGAGVLGEHDVLAFTTETRDLPADLAGDRAATCVAALRAGLPRASVFKKIDSAARGHFGLEISAALRASGANLALVAPAFPDAGRTVEAGALCVRDWSGQDRVISLRARFVHEEASAIEVLPAGSERELEQGIAHALSRGTRILLCDAVTQADLERLAAVALRAQQPIVWVGSAGLAYALAGLLPVASPAAAPRCASRRGRTLLFVGTTHPVTNLQISHLAQQPGAMDRAIHRVPCEGASVQEIVAAFSAEPVAALIVTGGDTAAFVLRALGASGIVLMGEIARGIPWGLIEGGMADGCVVVTKSGGFGQREALLHAFEFCERRACEPA